jgi:uncharacterized membrane-anchored protein YhcB (DUF1043 family)
VIQVIIGLVAGLAVAYFSYRLGERSARTKEKQTKHEEESEFKLYAEIVKMTEDGSVFHPSEETENFRLVMRLYQKGLVERLPLRGANYFTVPGAPIRLDTSEKVKR